jgi:diketogulonate reductase-like aldo/keto reductase
MLGTLFNEHTLHYEKYRELSIHQQAMEQQVDLGHAHNIGVSNFNISQLEKVVAAAKIYPATLQVELHAYLQQPELRACCAKLGIPLTAYSPLGSPGAKLHFQQKYNFHYQ